MININLPGFYLNQRFYGHVVKLMEKYPELVRPNTKIASVFGNFSWSIWNGGGVARVGHPALREEVKDVIDFYNYELQIPLRFTFTNPVLTEKHIYDIYSNMIAEVGNNGHNEILVASSVLEKHLKENYPNYKYCRSIIGSQNGNLDYIDDYNLVVLQRKMNDDWTILESIPYEKRSKVEILCTDPCPVDCPRIYSHYRDFGRATVEFYDGAECSMHQVKGCFPHHYMHQLPVHISWDRINNEYAPKGFTQFKVSGRGSIAGAVLAVSNYVIRPEYKDDMIVQGIDILTA